MVKNYSKFLNKSCSSDIKTVFYSSWQFFEYCLSKIHLITYSEPYVLPQLQNHSELNLMHDILMKNCQKASNLLYKGPQMFHEMAPGMS